MPDLMIALYDYPARDRFPAFNVMFRVNLVDGAT